MTRSLAVALSAAFALVHAAHAAGVDPAEYQSLLADASRQGAVRVMVTLDDRTSLPELGANAPAAAKATEAAAAALRRELGASAWVEGYWSNGAGQIGLFVTPAGLAILEKTGAALSFMRDPTHAGRARIFDTDGRLRAIEQALDARGEADVALTLNVDDLDFDIDRAAAARARPASRELPKQAQAALQAVRTSLADRRSVLAGLKVSAENPALLSLPIDRRAFVLLAEHPAVRSLKLAGWSNDAPPRFDEDLFAMTAAGGIADATIVLRLPDPVVMGAGHMAPRAWQAQRSALRRAFDEMLAGIPGLTQVQDLTEFGAVSVKLDRQALVHLRALDDARLLEVRAEKPAAEPLLATSKQSMNMLPYWSAGYRAAGQNIVVMDTGVRKSHGFFRDDKGASRVVYEACFGTNASGYTSPCPAPNAAGDSPPNYPGSGEPAPGCAGTCPYHGTHVAGIAAGRETALLAVAPYGGTLQGVAPDARIVSAQIFSRNASGGVTAFRQDMAAALQALNASTSLAASNYTVVLGAGDSAKYTADCPGYDTAMTNAIAALYSKNIPVVIGTGNAGATAPRLGIGAPACIPRVIKVAATVNDLSGNTLHATANIAPDTFNGPVLLAPGWQLFSATGISETAINQFGGASYAAPQVAGFYAVAKAAVPGWSIADITAWVYGAGSVAAPQSFTGLGSWNFRRVRAPCAALTVRTCTR